MLIYDRAKYIRISYNDIQPHSMLRKTQEIEANVEGAELMSFRVLWFVVAGFVIGFTTSTLWEWLYYRRKRLAMLAGHSEFVRDAGRQQSAANHAHETATSEATEWRTPFYRSPGVFLESEQPPADSTFTGTAFTPSTAPWVAPPPVTTPATAYTATGPATPAPLDEAEGDDAIRPGRPYRAATSEDAAPTSGPHKIMDGTLPYTPQSTVPFQPATLPLSSFTRDKLSPAEQVEEAQAAVAPATHGPRAAYANVIIVDQVTADVESNNEATPAAQTASVGMSDKPLPPNTADNTAAAEADEDDAADFNVVELTAPAPAAVTTQMAGPSQVTKPAVAAVQLTRTVESAAAALPASPLAGEPAEQRPHERTPRERPDDYPDDLAMIKGIGEAYKRRLYATGIYTWRQVAENDLDSLRRITRAKPNADIQSWQTQARELAEKYQRWEAHFSGPLDDLTQIDGIGAITADMLYKAGLCTYAILAQASPDELARIVPAPTVGNENDFDGWIREAQRLDGVKRKNQGLLA